MNSSGLRVRLLGPLEVWRAGACVEVGGERARIVLATMALSAGRPVSAAAIAERVWGEHPPQSVEASLSSHMTRLRRALGEGAIRSVAAGYVLGVDPEHVDVLRFRRLAADAARQQDPEKSRELLASALGLWRGEPLEGLPAESFQRDVVPALVEERLSAVQRRIDLDLAAEPSDEQYAELTTELLGLVGRHPLREPLWRQLITVLAAGGRRADALDAYEQLRVRLREQLGTDPAPDLQDLHQRLLDGGQPIHLARSLSRATPAAPETPQESAKVRRELPGDLADFSGRELELHELLAGCAEQDAARTLMISAIDGMAGVGKTTLAVRAAHRLAPQYPDGQLFIDLRDRLDGPAGVDPSVALDTLLRAIGVPGEHIPETLRERSALWRSRLADRRVLVVLDNAVTAAQVSPLLPGTAGCLAIVTGRRRLAELDGASHLALDVLTPLDALELFAAIVGAQRTAAEPEAAREVLRLCGYLPLAVRIAAARLAARPAWSIAHLVRRLADEGRRLDELAIADRSVAAAFHVSYEQLPPGHQRLFRLLGPHQGPDFDPYLAAAAAGLGAREAESILEDLLDVHLLQQHEPGRYKFHDLVRDHARGTTRRLDSEPERRAALGRILDYFLRMAALTDGLIGPGRSRDALSLAEPPRDVPPIGDQLTAVAWCERELPNVLAAVTEAAENGRPRHVWLIPLYLFRFVNARSRCGDLLPVYLAALTAAERSGDDGACAETLRILGMIHIDASRLVEALEYQQLALARFRQVSDEQGEARTMGNLAYTLYLLGRYDEAVRLNRQTIELSRRIGDRRIEALSTCNIAGVYLKLGRYADATRSQKSAVGLFERLKDLRMESAACSALGNIHRQLGEYEQALAWHQRSARLVSRIGDPELAAMQLHDMGCTYLAAGQREHAADCHRKALAVAQRIGVRLYEALSHDGLAQCLVTVDPEAARDHWNSALVFFEEAGMPEAEAVRASLQTH